MRRLQNSAADATDALELTRRLYRGATDVAKRLDEQKACALMISDIFTPSGEVLRGKLKDYCERLIFKDPVGHARKIEELLWRRGFYDAVSAAKKLRKGNTWTEVEKALLTTHLAAGVGFYHHLILRLQYEYGLELAGVIDFAYPKPKNGLSDHPERGASQKSPSDETKQCVIRIIHRSLICLGDLARYKLDLESNWDAMIATRYYKMAVVLDPSIGMPHNQLGTLAGNRNYGVDAVYHYMRCILCPESFEGAEGNLKRIISTHFFSGKEKLPSQRCAARLFTLLQKWNSDSSVDRVNEDSQSLLADIESCLVMKKPEVPATNARDAHTIEDYLQHFKSEPSACLTDDVAFKIVAICLMSISKLQAKQSTQMQGVIAFVLSLLSQLIQITIDSLQDAIVELTTNGQEKSEENSKRSAIESEGIIPENPVTKSLAPTADDAAPNVKEIANGHGVNGHVKSKARKNLVIKLRRRRKRVNSSDSDASDIDGLQNHSSSEEFNSDISETEEEDAISEGHALSDAFSDELTDEEVKNGVVEANGHEGAGEKIETNNIDRGLTGEEALVNPSVDEDVDLKENIDDLKKPVDSAELFDLLSKEGLLCSIKICFDWLQSNPEVIKTVSTSSRLLLHRIATLMNVVNVDFEPLLATWDRESLFTNREKISEYVESIPLPEDIDLRGLNILAGTHNKLNWEILRTLNMRKQEEVLLRVLKLLEFGKHLGSTDECTMRFDSDQRMFVVVDFKRNEVENPVEPEKSDKDVNGEHPRGKLMRHMGKLWLKAEVRALESRLRSKLMSPYLVPDHEALAKHTPALKRLVYAKKFIIVIPSIVVSALDEMKRTSGRAREATRWLETQLQKGSRFLRAQRPQERLALPLIKGPKPKDKEAWLFFQIIECCHYLTQQMKVGVSSDTEPPIVTLLTGVSLEERKLSTFSPDGLAKSAGVNLEHIESFHTKWKTSSKSHG